MSNREPRWIPFAEIQKAWALAPVQPAKPDYWWRASYTSLRRNMNNDDLVDRFDAICGEVIDPRRDVIMDEGFELPLAA